jgi:hypothetical protein
MKRSRKSVRTIAKRKFSLGRKAGAVQVSLGLPEIDPHSPHRDWRCPFRITGIDLPRVRYAYGIDAFQSLMMALAGIRSLLQTKRRDLRWDGGSLDLAFTRFVPSGYGPAFSKRIQMLIDREVEAFARKAERRAARQSKGRREV